ncbi:uncharacterized protein P174DRAFT_425229 [Aspergillus novofumigatus IBT 16806]|uniref:Uncharacterized protein n=1 Tax=Aspergillus novofumigatus (strain IBT 16806) TaxID=1392255 RepID=A0A2I1BV81_ASPN1|nr:uncharacterized protein P174DRAFT_425229 [Aspergillus novofumigatus IBT 16806]PKX89300.1 hypothetical protein P174DRAFT_425229 [Aspergillus novofumigatus IBT 16806]
MTKTAAVKLIDFLQGLTVPIASLSTERASYDSPYLSESQTWRCWHHGKLPIPSRQPHIDVGPFTYFGNEPYSFIRFLPEKFRKVLQDYQSHRQQLVTIPGSEEPMVTSVHVVVGNRAGMLKYEHDSFARNRPLNDKDYNIVSYFFAVIILKAPRLDFPLQSLVIPVTQTDDILSVCRSDQRPPIGH